MSFADADAVARCSCRLPVSNLLVLIKAPRNSGGEIGFLPFFVQSPDG
jgi:hypothetical protein